MRLKSVLRAIVGRINSDKPLLGKPLEAEAGRMVAHIALTFGFFVFAYALVTLAEVSLTLATYL